MGELILGHPLFPGESGVDQLVEIIKILGTPTKEQIRSINPNYNEFKFPSIKAHSWSKLFKDKASPEEIDLISKILVYEPNKRYTALQIIAHPCFNELRDEKTTLQGGGPLPDLFNFTKGYIKQKNLLLLQI